MDLWEFSIVDSDQERNAPPYFNPPSDGSCLIDELPADILRSVFSVLPLEDHGFVVPHVSQRWRSLCQLKMGHKSPPSSILLSQNNRYIVTVQLNNTVLLWDLIHQRAIERMRCTSNLLIGLGGIVEISKSQLTIYRSPEETESFHFPHSACLFLKDGSIIGISSNKRTRYTFNPYTEHESVIEDEIPSRNISAGVFSNEVYGYCRSPLYLVIFKTKDLKRVACLDLGFHGVASRRNCNPVDVSEDGLSISVQENGGMAIFRRPRSTAHIPEKIACKMWVLQFVPKTYIVSLWDENLTLGLGRKEDNVLLHDQNLNNLKVFQNYSEYCWISQDFFYISNRTQLELYTIRKRGLTFEPVLLKSIKNIDTEHIYSITKLSSQYFATVNGYNNVIVWDDNLTVKWRLTGNIIQGGNLVKLDDNFFAISCQDHIIVHKIGRFGSTHVYSIPHTKIVYKIECLSGKGYALTSDSLIIWEVSSGKIITTENLSSCSKEISTSSRIWLLSDGTLSISLLNSILFINENWGKGQFQHLNIENRVEGNPEKDQLCRWQNEAILVHFEDYNDTLFVVLSEEKLFVVRTRNTRVFNWKTLKLESYIEAFNYKRNIQQFQQIGHVVTFTSSNKYYQFDLSSCNISSATIGTCIDTYQQTGYLLCNSSINTIDLRQWTIESFDVEKLNVGSIKELFVLDDDIVVLFRSSKVVSFQMKENAFLKIELVGVSIKHRSQVCVSDNRRMIAIQISSGLHIGMLCPHPTHPFLNWRFIEMDSEITENSTTLFFNSQHNIFVALGKGSIYTFYTDQEVGFSTLPLL